jgi:hypothetical protein
MLFMPVAGILISLRLRLEPEIIDLLKEILLS